MKIRNMLTIDKYKQQPQDWKPETVNFKGPIDFKHFVQKKKREWDFVNEGQVLDYIQLTYPGLLAELAETVDLNKTLAAKLLAAEEKLAATEKELLSLKENAANTPPPDTLLQQKYDLLIEEKKKTDADNHQLSRALDKLQGFPVTQLAQYLKLKDAFEIQLPKLAGHPEIERVPVSDEQFMLMIVEFCTVDPHKEFPLEETCKKIFNAYVSAQKKQEETGGENGNTAGSNGTENGATGNK